MAAGYPPGPPKSVAKQLNLRDINTYQRLHEEFGDIFMLPLGKIPLVVQVFIAHSGLVLFLQNLAAVTIT